MAKKRDLKAMGKEELEKNQKEIRMELIKLNSQRATGTVPKNPGQIKQFRRVNARIINLIKQGKTTKTKEAAKKK